MDFTLDKYSTILDAAQEAGYTPMPFNDWFIKNSVTEGDFLIRHDVDRLPKRALAMAELEKTKNITSSYYFRIVPTSLDKGIIREIAEMGHEIGYHYEDWYLAKYAPQTAISLYRKHLEILREIVPIKTIAMHGSPLSRQSNLTIWQHYDLCQENVLDVIKSADFSDFAFFTDTGRTFGQSKANLRDFVGANNTFEDINTSDELATFIRQRRHKLIYLSVHPERWTNQHPGWAIQFAKDNAINGIKRALQLLR